MYPVVYWCEIYDSYEQKTLQVSGCTFAENYTEAMEHIEAYYGDMLCEVKIQLIEESSILEFKTYEEAKKIVTDV